MDLGGRPLLDNDRDRALFGGRQGELDRLVANIRNRHNVLLVGDRGSGKTTLLRQALLELRREQPDDAAPVFVEGRLADSVATFVDLVRVRLGLDPTVRGPNALQSQLRMFSPGRPVLEESLELPRLIASLRNAVPDGTWRGVLVDEMPSGKVAQTLFGRLRDELWQVPLVWGVAVSESDIGSLLEPPADAFFDVVVRLKALERTEQKELLRARAGGATGNRLAATLDEGNPRRLLALARESEVGGEDVHQLMKVVTDRQERVARLGSSASMLLGEMESLGPVSASDSRLLSRLGWTRERAVQVLRKLEKAGVVEASTAKGDTGRPRKIYRLVDLVPNKPGVAGE
jgi:DNA replicative helicase MCM subunit Mcm2 (Cdc46/Mcm family)